jgi:hypothetical protein
VKNLDEKSIYYSIYIRFLKNANEFTVTGSRSVVSVKEGQKGIGRRDY